MPTPSDDIAHFARYVLGQPLYPYQLEIVETILRSIRQRQGRLFTVMLSRQSGKNQLSAVLEAYLLAFGQGKTIVKAAPTFSPQIMHSRLRLLSLLNNSVLRDRVWQSDGHIVGLAPWSAQRKHRVGPRVMFFSGAPTSNVVGATADLLLELDEAQDIAPDKFDRDFRPMASTTNATTILYGTAWTPTTLLARQRAINLEIEQRTGIRLHFEHDWHTLAALNPAYRSFVQGEIARLGEAHVTIQTQYLLRPLNEADRLLSVLQQTLLRGQHAWEGEPASEAIYVAGMDIGGEEHQPLQEDGRRTRGRDSTVITIGRVSYTDLNLPMLEVVHHEWWTGKPYREQYAATRALVEHWRIRVLVVDATGLGATLAALLRDYLGDERVIPFVFTRPTKSRLAYQLLALINSGRLTLYQMTESSSHAEAHRAHEECWRQLQAARYRLPAPDTLDIFVDPAEGHDDFLLSLALLTASLASLAPPAYSAVIPAAHGSSWYRCF